MNKYLLGGLTAIAAMGAATSANATLTSSYVASTVANPNFYTDDTAFPFLSSTIGQAGINDTDFVTNFLFYVPTNGIGSGSLTTNILGTLTGTNLDFTSVALWAIAGVVPTTPTAPYTLQTNIFDAGPLVNGASEKVDVGTISLQTNQWYSLIVKGKVATGPGTGSFGGQFSFAPTAAVPEAGTWAMMILGMGAVGYAMRRRRQTVNSMSLTYA